MQIVVTSFPFWELHSSWYNFALTDFFWFARWQLCDLCFYISFARWQLCGSSLQVILASVFSFPFAQWQLCCSSLQVIVPFTQTWQIFPNANMSIAMMQIHMRISFSKKWPNSRGTPTSAMRKCYWLTAPWKDVVNEHIDEDCIQKISKCMASPTIAWDANGFKMAYMAWLVFETTLTYADKELKKH